MGHSSGLLPAMLLSAALVAGSAGPDPRADPRGGAASRGAVPAAATATVLIGAGDIADCAGSGDSRTLALLQRFPGRVFTLGDNAYPNGSRADFARCYEPTWGKVKDRTRPVLGNHDYRSEGGAPYFDYFGPAAGPRGKGYYSYDVGAWHVVVLNTNCASVPGGCGPGSAQQRWLSADLAGAGSCTVAMTHHPQFSSAKIHPPTTQTLPLVRVLYDAGVELLLSGHDHAYERFAPQTPAGRPDPGRGIRQIIAGTGGAELHPFGPVAANSERRDNHTLGVLRLTLRPGAYRWDFLPVAGETFTDSGTGTCH
ncbi:metallophosphoesterase [Actinoplanes sp. NPDC026623]|uniref:metallophosphoesterase family protein n=1 Tax=Actinoplanes sp. NPDC026623 TaxID=3155610 RepID=UPI0033EE4EA6